MTGCRQRRFHGLVAQFYNSPHLKAQVTRDMQKYLEDRMSRWKDDQLIHIQEESNNIAVPVLVKAVLQVKEGKEMQLLKQHIKVFMAGLFCLPLNFLGTQLYKALQAKKSMTKLIRKIMEERKKTGHNPSVPKDVLDVLLNDAPEQFCFDEISIHVIEVIGASDENTTSLLTLVVKYLSDCPRALQQLTEENIELRKEKAQLGQSLCWNDYMSLSFTQDVITETLRIANVLLGTMRKATKDIDVNGYHIPERWCVFTNFPSIHLDQIAYSSPYEFNPWRWQRGCCQLYSFWWWAKALSGPWTRQAASIHFPLSLGDSVQANLFLIMVDTGKGNEAARKKSNKRGEGN